MQNPITFLYNCFYSFSAKSVSQHLLTVIAITCLLSFPVLQSKAQPVITIADGFPVGSQATAAAYGNGAYVVVGNNGYIVRSTDGVHWSIKQSAASFLNVSYNSVTYGNSLFVAVTGDGKIVTSPDGITWTQRTSGTTNALLDITYGGGKFIAAGSAGTVLSSTDGITWTSITTGGAASDQFINIIYTGSQYVIGSRDGATGGAAVFYSTTGATGTWTKVTVSSNGIDALNRLVYVNSRFYIFTPGTAGGARVYTATNVTSWSQVTNTRITGTTQLFDAFYDGTTSYFFGTTPEYSYGSVITSTDLTNFTLQPRTTSITATKAAYRNGLYFQFGNEGIATATNGSNWSIPGGVYLGITSNGGQYVAVGQITTSDAGIFTSADGTNWVSRSYYGKPLNGVVYGNGKYVAVGNIDVNTFSTFATSVDGVVWVPGNTGIGDNLRSVAYGNNKYVAVGLNGRIIYSADGLSWSSAENVTGYNYYSVAYLNNRFIAVGGSTAVGGAAKVKYSSDGVTWTDASPSITGQFHSIAYNGSKFVLVGRDNTSGSQKFITVTTSDITNTTAYSATVTVTSADGDIGTLGFGGIAYGNGYFMAIANLKVSPFTAYILTSTDGATWTVTNAGSVSRLRGITYKGSNVFKVVGLANTIMNANIGTALPLTLLQFTGKLVNNKTQLNWNTSSEMNTLRFDIETSADGVTFHKIGEVAAAEKSSTIKNYVFTHANPVAGNNFYRLKMIDIDQQFTYSNIVKIQVTENERSIALYPNPLQGNMITINAAQGVTLPLNYVIYDVNGKKVLEGRLLKRSQEVQVPSLLRGTYSVSFSNGTSLKLLKQ